MKFENTIVINKPVKEVFSYLADVERLPDWNYAIRRTTKVTPGPVHVGTRCTQERSLPHPMTEAPEITAYEQNVLLEISGGFGPFPVGSSSYHLEALDGGRTLLRNEIQLDVKGLLQLAAPLASLKLKAAVGQNLEVLKQNIES